MTLVLRYVDKSGELIKRFLGIVYVSDTSARSLQKAIYSLLEDHSLCLLKLCGQGYDDASNMQEEKNGLKSLILQDAPSAYCIHCFAHQLQLALVALSRKHSDVKIFFYVVTNVLNTIGTSFKRRELLRQHQVEKLEELLKAGEIFTGQGLNQEPGLQRLGDTRWRSHFKNLENFMVIFSSIANVLKDMKEYYPLKLDRLATGNLLDNIQEFEFVFILHLMFNILLFTNELNKALQKKDQDFVNAMEFLNLAKIRLQKMRESELESLMDDVYSFCGKHENVIPKMDDDYPRSKRKRSGISYLHHFHVEVFYAVIDLQLQELNNRFDVVTSDLLLGMASLNHVDSFPNFGKNKTMKLAGYQLDSFIVYARQRDSKFLNLKGIKDLSIVMAKIKLDQTWSLVYLLVKLTLILPVATASVERAFSSMKLIKNDLRNRIGGEFLNGCLVCKIERKVFATISNDAIMDRFQRMNPH
ncbi:uncharacterized protein LOC132624746 [Lycium barbarum]|uniref:uncharacterized protein LOC132624746 n=1 Tax=Lycium barbarum TaxID=112863 RepID=UPI00293F0F10|nr:uncharacterized protein LOC132624746 [Lycium barbarum]